MTTIEQYLRVAQWLWSFLYSKAAAAFLFHIGEKRLIWTTVLYGPEVFSTIWVIGCTTQLCF